MIYYNFKIKCGKKKKVERNVPKNVHLNVIERIVVNSKYGLFVV